MQRPALSLRLVAREIVAVATVLATAAVTAQSHLVVPPLAATAEANGVEFWAAGPFSARRQVVLDASWLQAAVGRGFTAIAVRRNQGTADDQVAGRLLLDIDLAHASTAPPNASGSFAANRGPNATNVFAGLVAFPAAPAAPTTPAPWQAPYAVTIPFTTPFAYRGGPLVVETVTRPLSGPSGQNPWWPIDAVIGASTGSVRSVGWGCLAAGTEPAAGAELGSVSLGATAVFWLRGQMQAGPATCLLGGDNRSYQGLPLPLDLTVIGMPGCVLYNDIATAVPSLLTPWPLRPDTLATVEVPVPQDAALAGASLFAQWLVPNIGGRAIRLETSNGVEAVIGALPANPGAAWIEGIGPYAIRGRVLHDRCPVLRLDYWP